MANWVALAAVTALSMALAACGPGSAPPGTVAATVNGDAITVQQVRAAVAMQGGQAQQPDQPRRTAVQVLNRIIDQELLVQRAFEARVDRNPAVIQAIENLKRQVLAQAYLEELTGAATITPEEIRAFYRAHPLLFERRRLYNLHEMSVTAPAESMPMLQQQVLVARSPAEISAWLTTQKLVFTESASAKFAEQLPMDFVARIEPMKSRDIEVFPVQGGAWIVQLLRSEPAFLSERQAGPVIERFLGNRKRAELASAEIGRLRKLATIEFAGEFRLAAVDSADLRGRGSRLEGYASKESGLSGL